MEKQLYFSDYVLLMLFFAFMLHHSPFIGSLMSPLAYASIVIVMFVLICAFFYHYQSLLKYLLPLFAIFFLDLLFYRQWDTSDGVVLSRMISGIMQELIMPLLAGYAIAKKNVTLVGSLLFIFISVEFVTYITSIIAEFNMPGIIRLNPGQLRQEDTAMYALKTTMNVGNFDTVYGCSSLIPISILFIRWRKLLFTNQLFRFSTFVYLVISLYFIYVSQFAIALVGSFIFLLTFALPQKMTIVLFRKTMVIGIIVLLFSYTFLPVILNYVASNLESEIMAERLQGVASMLVGETDYAVDVENRQNLYMEPIETIMDTNFLGSWKDVGVGSGGGAHSFILDHLALYGIVGLFLLVVFYKGLLKIFYHPYKRAHWIYYFIYGLLGVTFFYIMNPSPLYVQMTFCYPLLAFWINSKLKNA